MEKPWDERWGCHVGIIKNEKIYAMTFGGSSKRCKGFTHYLFTAQNLLGQAVKLEYVPTDRVLRRLAKKYLKSTYQSDFGRKVDFMGFFFQVRSRIPQEDLSVFLAAVVAKGLR